MHNLKLKTISNHLKAVNIIICLIMVFFFAVSCNDQITPLCDAENTSKSYQTNTVSVIDGNPVVKLNTESSEALIYLENFRDKLASTYGEEIISGLNTAVGERKSKGTKFIDNSPQLLHSLIGSSGKNKGENVSTHTKLVDPGGYEEEFALSVSRYVPSPSDDSQKENSIVSRTLTGEHTWIALNVDRFYLQDDDNGNELWPVTFSAVSMSDDQKKIDVTFDKNGLVSTSLNKGRHNWENFNLIFIDPISAKVNQEEEMRARVNDWGRGEDTGSYGPNDTYFTLELVHLAWTGDGDGAAELQVFVKNDDNYNNNLPNKYKYRLDDAYRSHPDYGWGVHSIIEGADKGNPYDIYYEVPDINHDGTNYSFQNIEMWFKDNDEYDTMNVDRFPLFNFDDSPGPWRFVFSDDDKDYDKFSRRRASNHADYVQTYDMSTGNWGSVYTGFTVERKTYGSSDDPILESGVRRITESNAINRSDHLGKINASKSYDGGSRLFKYRFGMDQVVI